MLALLLPRNTTRSWASINGYYPFATEVGLNDCEPEPPPRVAAARRSKPKLRAATPASRWNRFASGRETACWHFLRIAKCPDVSQNPENLKPKKMRSRRWVCWEVPTERLPPERPREAASQPSAEMMQKRGALGKPTESLNAPYSPAEMRRQASPRHNEARMSVATNPRGPHVGGGERLRDMPSCCCMREDC